MPPLSGISSFDTPETLPFKVNLSKAFLTESPTFIFLTNFINSSLLESMLAITFSVEPGLPKLFILISPSLILIPSTIADSNMTLISVKLVLIEPLRSFIDSMT